MSTTTRGGGGGGGSRKRQHREEDGEGGGRPRRLGLSELEDEEDEVLVYPVKKIPEQIETSKDGDEEEDNVDMIEVILNDRLGKKVRVKCNTNDTIRDLKLLTAAQTGTRPEKLRFQKWYTVLKDHITLADYEIKDGMSLELYYN